MKNQKKNDVAALLDYAGSHRRPDLSGAGPVGSVHAAEYGTVYLHLAGCAGSDCRSARLDPGCRMSRSTAGWLSPLRWAVSCCILQA